MSRLPKKMREYPMTPEEAQPVPDEWPEPQRNGYPEQESAVILEEPEPQSALYAQEFEKRELVKRIREEAAALAITARLAEKKGLAVKIAIETPAPHMSENAVYTVSITETKIW